MYIVYSGENTARREPDHIDSYVVLTRTNYTGNLERTQLKAFTFLYNEFIDEMMDHSKNDLRRPLLSIPKERDAGVGDDDVGRSGMNRTTRSELDVTGHYVFIPRSSSSSGSSSNNNKNKHQSYSYGDGNDNDTICCGDPTWIFRSIYSAINPFCLYIQFRLVYYEDVMVNTGKNVTYPAWRAIERNMLLFVTIYIWYRVLRTDNRNTIISTVLQSLPDIIIAILMILLLFRLLETAVVFMQHCTIVLAIIALWSGRSSTVDVTTATTGTPTIPISDTEKEQSNSTRPRYGDDSHTVNGRSFAVIV
jgi:hypothetical protein